MTPTWALVLSIGSPLLTLIGVVGAAAIGAWAGRKAANKSAQANADTAAATLQNAYTEAARQQDEHWKRFCDANDRTVDYLRKQVSANSQAIEDANLRLEEAERRAHNWEMLYRKATIYLRKLILWLDERLPGETYPHPPPELDLDI